MTAKNRRNRSCIRCAQPTKSATATCWRCRRPDDIPAVTRVGDGNLVSFAGQTYTLDQARRLADSIHDQIERDTHD